MEHGAGGRGVMTGRLEQQRTKALNYHPFDWTAGHVETLTRMLSYGATMQEIADALGGGVTRNAVLGKAHKLGLGSNIRRGPRVDKPARPHREARTRSLPPIIEPEGPPKLGSSNKLLTSRVWHALPGMPVIPVEAHQAECRWPIGDPLQPGFGFCGGLAVEGSSYCEAHRRISKRSDQ